MVPVEYLVVGEEADALCAVGESLVERAVHGLKVDAGVQTVVRAGVGGCLLAREDVSQSLYLLGAVGQDEEAVSLQQIVFECLCEQVEVFVEERLRRDVELQGGRRCGRGVRSELYAPQGPELTLEDRLRYELRLPSHLFQYLGALHLGCCLEPLGERLLCESLVVDMSHGLAHIVEVSHHEQCALGQELRERHFLGRRGQFGHDVGRLPYFLRELALDVEGAYGVNLIAEEVDAEGQLAAVGVDIDDAASLCELSRFVDIVLLLHAPLPHLFHQFVGFHLVAHIEVYGLVLESFFRHHELAERLGARHDDESVGLGVAFGCGPCQPCQHLGAQYSVGRIALRILHRPAVGRRVEEHLVLPQYLEQVVVEIAGLLGILQHGEHRVCELVDGGGEHEGCGRSLQPLQKDESERLVLQHLEQGFPLCRRCI